MRSTAAARRYARALFSIASDEAAIPTIRRELELISQLLLESPALHHALFRPLHPAKERVAVLTRVCERVGTSATVRKFLAYLIDQRRLVDFEAVRDEYARLADEAAGRIKAQIRTPVPLADEARERLRGAITRRTGLEVDLQVEVDPDLIGGAIAKVGGVVFDGSLRTQLSQLRVALTRGH